MQYTFKAVALMRLIQIVDLWPAPNRNMMKTIDALASKLAMTKEDLSSIDWRSSSDGSQIMFKPDVTLTKELDEQDVAMLRAMAENPPERFIWTRGEMALQQAVFEPLGIESWI